MFTAADGVVAVEAEVHDDATAVDAIAVVAIGGVAVDDLAVVVMVAAGAALVVSCVDSDVAIAGCC